MPAPDKPHRLPSSAVKAHVDPIAKLSINHMVGLIALGALALAALVVWKS